MLKHGKIQKRFTLSEASFVIGQPRKTLDRAIERGEVKARLTGNRVRTLDFGALRALCLQTRLGPAVTLKGRKALHQAIAKAPADQHHLVWLGVGLDLTPIDDLLVGRLGALEGLQAAVVERDGRAVLRGTDISAHQIAALAAGQGVQATLEDYPELTKEQVQTAVDYARAYPKAGRPYPGKSFKRMLSDAAGAGAFDVDTSDLAVTPDDFR